MSAKRVTFYLKSVAVLMSATLLWAAFPPMAQGEAALVALVPLLLLIRYHAPRKAAQLAWWVGLLFWVATLSWFPAIIKNGGPWALVLLGQLGLSAWCAAFMALFAYVSAHLWRWSGRGASWCRVLLVTLLDPLLWCGAELLRGTLFSGFAWNFLGVSQVANLPLIQVAAVVGVYGVSAVVVMVNGAIASLLERLARPMLTRIGFLPVVVVADGTVSRLWRWWWLSLESMVPVALLVTCWFWGLMRMEESRRELRQAALWRVALVQPNTPCIFTLGSELVRQQQELLLRHTELTGASRPDLVVWPETAVMGVVPDAPVAMHLIREGAKAAGAPLLTGTLEREETPVTAVAADGYLYYNAAWLFSANGEHLGRYRKQHLVPFGEYIPLDKRIPLLQRLAPTGTSCTPGRGAGVLHLARAPGDELAIGPLICFEDTVPRLSRAAVRGGARLLALMTNDAWFNGSIEPVQHLHQSIFRAVENGVPLVRAANSGVSGVVDALGSANYLSSKGSWVDVDGFLVTQVRVPHTPLRAPYTRWGDRVWAVPGAVLLVALAVGAWSEEHRRVRRVGLEEQMEE